MNNKNMTIQQFVSAKTVELLDFQNYWFTTVYCNMSDEDRAYWDYQANMWDWAEYYDHWVCHNSKVEQC
jgi:hypothetical protein